MWHVLLGISVPLSDIQNSLSNPRLWCPHPLREENFSIDEDSDIAGIRHNYVALFSFLP